MASGGTGCNALLRQLATQNADCAPAARTSNAAALLLSNTGHKDSDENRLIKKATAHAINAKAASTTPN